ncbi:MAG: TlpA family protein disulfide reductase [Spirochaetaceae bacterium]|nr:TlpA family protein disulfide reductase [Spirochaetaceae bacterium]
MQKKLWVVIFPLLFIFIMQIPGDSFRENLQKLGFQVITEDINYFDFNLPDLNGNRVRLHRHEGKVIMLTFWATWCPPCRNKMLALESLHREMANSNFMIIAVNIDENSSVAREFIQRNGYTFPVVLDENREIAAQYSVRSIPTTYIIDPRGRIAGVITGSRDWSSSETIKILRELSM